MIALIQRVEKAAVAVDGHITGQIGPGICALIGVEKADTENNAVRLLARVLSYRIFADNDGRMNRSLADTGGGLLLIPNFTLAADTGKGTRASFTPAAHPDDAERLFEWMAERARQDHSVVACGRFGCHMKVSLVNDGPVTFRLSA